MTTDTQEKPMIDFETGEVLDKTRYMLSLGLEPTFVIDTAEKMKWYMRERKKLVAVADETKATYKKEVDRAQHELDNFDKRFFEDAKRIAALISKEEGKKTVPTPYGAWKFVEHTHGSWQVENEDEIQTFVRFLPDKPDPENKLAPDKESWGVRPAKFTRDLEKIKVYCETIRKTEEMADNYREKGLPVPAEVLSVLAKFKLAGIPSGLKFKPPGTTVSISYAAGKAGANASD